MIIGTIVFTVIATIGTVIAAHYSALAANKRDLRALRHHRR